MEAQSGLEQAIRRGLSGKPNIDRYGLPFLGDNNFLLDVLEEAQPRAVVWACRVPIGSAHAGHDPTDDLDRPDGNGGNAIGVVRPGN